METITWTSKSGKTITATPTDDMPATWLIVTVDAKQIGNGYLLPITDKQVPAAVATQMTAAGLTHVIVCGKIPVGVPSEVAEQIKAAQIAAANRPASLESQREVLVAAVLGAGDQFAATREAAFHNDAGRGWDKVKDAEAAIATAEKALADFDAAHPEILAGLKVEQDQAAERFLNAN